MAVQIARSDSSSLGCGPGKRSSTQKGEHALRSISMVCYCTCNIKNCAKGGSCWWPFTIILWHFFIFLLVSTLSCGQICWCNMLFNAPVAATTLGQLPSWIYMHAHACRPREPWIHMRSVKADGLSVFFQKDGLSGKYYIKYVQWYGILVVHNNASSCMRIYHPRSSVTTVHFCFACIKWHGYLSSKKEQRDMIPCLFTLLALLDLYI